MVVMVLYLHFTIIGWEILGVFKKVTRSDGHSKIFLTAGWRSEKREQGIKQGYE